MVGYFGANGKDIPASELDMWLNGTMWQTELSRRAAAQVENEIESETTKEDIVSDVNEKTLERQKS